MKSFLNIDFDELCHLWGTYNTINVHVRPTGKIHIDYIRYFYYLNPGGYRRINFLRYIALLVKFRMMHYGRHQSID